MQCLPSFFSDSTIKNAGFSISLTFNLGLLTLDYLLLKWLTESTEENAKTSQNETALYGSCFAIAMVLTGVKFAWTAKNNRQHRRENLQSLLLDVDPIDEKVLRHNLIQTTTKLGFGAFGWQLAFILAQHWMGYDYDSDFTQGGWNQKAVAWLATGLGSVAFLNFGMLVSQGALFHCDNSDTSVSHLSIITVQLCISVLIADGLWLAFTDAALAISDGIVSDILCAAFYLLLSFIFKNVHNMLNHFHPDDEYYSKFDCDNAFVGVLWGAYFGFKFITDLFYGVTGLQCTQYNFVDVFLACLIAGVATAILPLAIGLGHYAQMKEARDNCLLMLAPLLERYEEVESVSQQWSILPEPVCSYAQRYGFYTPFTAFSQTVDAVVQFAADTCPKR